MIIVANNKYHFWHREWVFKKGVFPKEVVVREWEYMVTDEYVIERQRTGKEFNVPVFLWFWIRFLGYLLGSHYERVRIFAGSRYRTIQNKYKYPIDFIGISVYAYMPIMSIDLDECS